MGDYEKKRAEMIVGARIRRLLRRYLRPGRPPGGCRRGQRTRRKIQGRHARLYRERLTAALRVLEKQPQVDRTKLGVMGYCFGGTGALELARSGAPVLGTVSFHGGLGSKTPEDARKIKGRVLVLHGADDPFVPPAEVAAFKDEMKNAGVSHEFVAYPGAVHSFTHWEAGSDNSKGAAYNKQADEKSWAAMTRFWAECLRQQTLLIQSQSIIPQWFIHQHDPTSHSLMN